MVKKVLKNPIKSVSTFMKNSPIFSYWRTILFVVLTIVLLILFLWKFDFIGFYVAIKKLSISAFFWLILLSIIEQFISWERYRRFMIKSETKQVFDYIAVSTIASVVPPKPLGLYYRFIISLNLFKTNIKTTGFLIAIDTIFEAVATTLFAVLALFIFPRVNLGLQFVLYFFGILGLLYLIFVYYENRVYLIKSQTFKKLIEYLKTLKTKILDSFYSFIKKNLLSVFIGFLLSILKMFIGVLKVYLLFLFFGLEVNFWLVFGIWSIAFFVGTSSSLPGGLGAFELSFVYLSKAINIPESIAINVAVLERFFYIWVWAIFTGIFLLAKKISIVKGHHYFVAIISKIGDKINSGKVKSDMKNFYSIISTKIKDKDKIKK